MKTATLELYEFVESRIKAIEETIEKKGQSLTLEGELIAYNEMKEEIVRVTKIEQELLSIAYKASDWSLKPVKGKPVFFDKEVTPFKKWLNKTFKTCPAE
jgi:hypothetical protein